MVQPNKCSTVYVLELVGRGCVGRPGQYRAAVTNHCMSLSPPPRTPFPLAQPLLHLFIFFRFSFFPLAETPCPLVQLLIPSKIQSRNFFLLPAHIYIFSHSSNPLIQLSSKHMQSAYILMYTRNCRYKIDFSTEMQEFSGAVWGDQFSERFSFCHQSKCLIINLM